MLFHRLISLFDRYYPVLMCPVAWWVIHLNYHARAYEGTVSRYEDFKRIILAGFDPAAAVHNTSTWPMWGYGWLLILTENQLLLMALQNLLAIVATWAVIRCLEKHTDAGPGCIRAIKACFVVALPWYAFNSVRWPYGYSISLFLISFALFVDAVSGEKQSLRKYLASGLVFGLLLNFRSDYILMPVGFAFIALLYWRFCRVRAVRMAAWLGAIYLCLIPWAIYTKHVTGHYLLTSTNGGAVMYEGFGNLKDNKWGITLHDRDPSMWNLLESEFGHRDFSLFVSYEGDRFLRRKFLELVRADPSEYARKVFAAFKLMYASGAYPGEFWEQPECRPRCHHESMIVWRQAVLKKPFLDQIDDWKSPQGRRVLLGDLSKKMSFWVVKGAFWLTPVIVIPALRRRNLVLTLLLAGLGYQVMLNCLLAQKHVSTAMMYPVMIIVVCLGIFVIKDACFRILSLPVRLYRRGAGADTPDAGNAEEPDHEERKAA